MLANKVELHYAAKFDNQNLYECHNPNATAAGYTIF
jgi:hypothetical protein